MLESLKIHISGNCGESEGKVGESLWMLVMGKAQVGRLGINGGGGLGGHHIFSLRQELSLSVEKSIMTHLVYISENV